MSEEQVSPQLHPIYLNKPGFVPPQQGSYYLVAKDGVYMRMERCFGSATVKVADVPFLAKAPGDMTWNLPKIPGQIVTLAKRFFETVFTQHRSESYLTLLWSPRLNQYRLWCPKQRVSYASVNYERDDCVPFEESIGCDTGPGYQMVGTIHSHCDFSPFHSGTDKADEATFDGLHITFGYVNCSNFGIVSSIAVADNRQELDPSAVIEGVKVVGEETVRTSGSVRGSYYNRIECRYSTLPLTPDEEAGIDAQVREWMGKVTKTFYSVTTGDSYTPRRQTSLPFSGSISSSEWDESDRRSVAGARVRGGGFFEWCKSWGDYFKKD